MKKLLSLLSVLTISGSAIPTTIAASPYKKEEKLNNDINYQQIKRQKRNYISDYLDYNIKQIQKINNMDVFYMSFKKENEMYLGTRYGGFIYNLDEDKLTKINGLPNEIVWSITFNKNNNDIYFATEQGVYLLKSNEQNAIKINGTDGSARWVVIDSNNVCYFSIWQRGLFKLENNVLTKYNNVNVSIHSLAIDKDDNLFFGFWNENNSAVCVIKKGETDPIPLEIPLSNVGIIIINEKDNSIYFGLKNSIYVLKDSKINKIIDFNSGHVVMSIAIDLNDNLYFGTEEKNGNFIFNKMQNKKIRISELSTQSRSIIIDKNNNVYFGTINDNKGVYAFKNIKDTINNEINVKQTEINQLKTDLGFYKEEFKKIPFKYVSLDQDQFLRNIEKTIKKIEEKLNTQDLINRPIT